MLILNRLPNHEIVPVPSPRTATM